MSAPRPPLARLLAYVSRVPFGYAAGALLTLAYAALAPFIAIATGRVVDVLREQTDDRADAVVPFIETLLLLAAAVAAVRVLSRITIFRAARQIEYEIRNDLLTHLQKLPQSYYHRTRTGDLMSRAVNDLNSIRLFLGMGLMNIVQTPVFYLAAFSQMVALDPWLTAALVAPYALFVFIVRFFGQRMQPASLAVQEQLGALSAVAQENAAGVFVVRAYGMEARERERFADQNGELYGRQIRFGVIARSMQPTIAVLPALALVVLLYVGGRQVESGALTLGEFTAFNIFLMLLTPPTVMLGFTIVLAQRGLAGLARLGEVLDTIPSIREHDAVSAIERISGEVEVRELRFAFPGRESEPALRGISFRARPGQTIGVVGSVGSGKSTLVNAIPRLLEFDDGRVIIDGTDVNRIPLRALRQSIAMVPQDSFLFSTTVGENIAFGVPDATREQIREAARRAHVLDDIEDLPQGFDTPVGERGITLSGGQRQRVALARALILDPKILILDDALSSVDAVTEASILKDLGEARRGRTCFIVAHRLSAVRDADHILVLDQGRLIEQGTHAELTAQNGFYAQTMRRQKLEEELAAEEPA